MCGLQVKRETMHSDVDAPCLIGRLLSRDSLVRRGLQLTLVRQEAELEASDVEVNHSIRFRQSLERTKEI